MPTVTDDFNSPDNPSNPLFAKDIADGAFFAGIAAMFVIAIVVIGSIVKTAEPHSASATPFHQTMGRGAPGRG
jgi:hypothetical protein